MPEGIRNIRNKVGYEMLAFQSLPFSYVAKVRQYIHISTVHH